MDRNITLSFRVTEETRDVIHRAAEKSEMADSEWIRVVVLAAAGASELPEQLARVVKYSPRGVRDGKW